MQTRRYRAIRLTGAILALTLCATAPANPPLEPLPCPFYSFDLESPSVMSGLVGAADILLCGVPTPQVVVPANALGLLFPNDDLDGLALRRPAPLPEASFGLLFSVDRSTLGTVPPDPALVHAGVPFNVADQAARGQAAGDEFQALSLFSRDGGKLRERTENSVLVRNNFDEGGTSFSGQPPTSAQDPPSGAPQDNVDGASAGSAVKDRVMNVYFSLRRSSPSLGILPGHTNPSGAHIFFNNDPLGGSPTDLYAPFFALGLQQYDDIDAMVVFDNDANGVYSLGDSVLFSLTPDSPSVQLIPGASMIAPGADVYTASPGGTLMIFASDHALGLGAFGDNVDALDVFACNDAFACAVAHGIRSYPGDMNCDHVIDFADINPFVTALLKGQTGYLGQYPWCNYFNADTNGDGDVGFADINPFVALILPGPKATEAHRSVR